MTIRQHYHVKVVLSIYYYYYYYLFIIFIGSYSVLDWHGFQDVTSSDPTHSVMIFTYKITNEIYCGISSALRPFCYCFASCFFLNRNQWREAMMEVEWYGKQASRQAGRLRQARHQI